MKRQMSRYVVSAVCGVATLFLLFAGTGAPASAASNVKPNDYAHVANTDGDNINIRAGADSSYDIRDQLEPDQVVWVLEGPVKDSSGQNWFRVDVDGHIGWVAAAYLAPGKTGARETSSTTSASSATSKSTDSTPSKSTSSTVPALKAGSYAKVANTDGDMLRVHKTSSSDGKVTATIAPDTVLQVVKGPVKDSEGTNWYQVTGSNAGWVMGRYLSPTTKPKTTTAPAKAAAKPAAQPAATSARSGQSRGAAAAPAPPPSSASSAGALTIALRYVGTRYRWGGTTPAGFDCSGFVYYVFNKAGIGMPRSMDGEIASGPHISSSDLRPGDLVYFRNTYTRGISHIGIYAGNGKFVHAADYDTGVEVSDLWSSYWAAHYAGAVRVTR